MFHYGHLPSSSQSESGICRCLANKVGLGELNMGGGGIGPISLNGIGGSGSSDSIRVFGSGDRKGPASCNPLFVPRAREPIVTGENSGGGGGAFSFSVRVPPPTAGRREEAVEANGRTEVERKFAVLSSGLRDTRRERGES
ncbi:hypothetical protein ALC56_13378 [Trachymyrmex septentrionalis]|uniref:Uncharacterized protein n=1 Tax=Trachymyrmex septentrionalis TaxID=34720 RepID=A0A195EW74_9HYME|nr:hypothetical protein ALC56_13378 [Trachymyrmex septentrionalis]